MWHLTEERTIGQLASASSILENGKHQEKKDVNACRKLGKI